MLAGTSSGRDDDDSSLADAPPPSTKTAPAWLAPQRHEAAEEAPAPPPLPTLSAAVRENGILKLRLEVSLAEDRDSPKLTPVCAGPGTHDANGTQPRDCARKPARYRHRGAGEAEDGVPRADGRGGRGREQGRGGAPGSRGGGDQAQGRGAEPARGGPEATERAGAGEKSA
ncbi:hypothetical protein DFJ74DRAFT_686426 [Hyaloraphidium curvatum]|nr:hypothetical protein DFJ74DRAFT_686426 [Hyaloraphidium curvatum]